MLIQGRIISRDRLVRETNQNVTFYSIKYLNKEGQLVWAQIYFADALKPELKKIEVPGLVEVNIYSARKKTNTGDDGVTYVNKIFYADSITQVASIPALEDAELASLEEKVNG